MLTILLVQYPQYIMFIYKQSNWKSRSQAHKLFHKIIKKHEAPDYEGVKK